MDISRPAYVLNLQLCSPPPSGAGCHTLLRPILNFPSRSWQITVHPTYSPTIVHRIPSLSMMLVPTSSLLLLVTVVLGVANPAAAAPVGTRLALGFSSLVWFGSLIILLLCRTFHVKSLRRMEAAHMPASRRAVVLADVLPDNEVRAPL